MFKQKLPKKFAPYFWSLDYRKLDLDKDVAYIMHRVMVYGDLDDIAWLKDQYGMVKLKRVFELRPEKVYTPKNFYFITRFILNFKKSLNQDVYLKNTQRSIR